MANKGQKADLSTADYLKAVQRYPWVVAVPVLLLGFLAWFLLGRGAASFEASADVLVRESDAQQDFETGNNGFDPNFLRNEVSFAISDDVRTEVASRLGIEPFAELDDVDVTIVASETSEVLTFTAQSGTAAGAAEMANTYAESYVSERREAAVASYDSSIELLDTELQQIRDGRADLRSELDSKIISLADLDEEGSVYARRQAEIVALETSLSAQLEALNTEETAMIQSRSDFRVQQNLARSGIATVSNAAFAPAEPLPNAGIRGFIIAELIGLVLGLLLAVTVYNMDDRLRETSDVESAFPDMAILGTLPYQSSVRKRRSLTVLSEPSSAYSEAIYQVRTSLRFMMLEKGVRMVVVTSSQPAEGKTTFSSNFAWSMAGPDDRVVLVDGDLRRPVTHEHFGVDLAPGLTDLVLYKRQLESLERVFDEQDDGFSFVPAGIYSGNPADFMGSNQLVRQLRAVSEEALVVVDAAPVLPVSDARAIAGASDLTILIVRLEESRRRDVAAAIQSLRNSGARNIAMVLVGGRTKAPTYYGTSGEKRNTASGTGQPTLAPVSRRAGSVASSVKAKPPTKPSGPSKRPAEAPLKQPAPAPQPVRSAGASAPRKAAAAPNRAPAQGGGRPAKAGNADTAKGKR